MAGEIDMETDDTKMSWPEILKFAKENNWHMSEIEEYKKRHECGEYISKMCKDGTFVQQIRIIKLEINHTIGGVNHLLLHTPTSELMKHKLPGGKQSNVDRYTHDSENPSLWDSFTGLREATEELCLQSPRLPVYVAQGDVYLSFNVEEGKFVSHKEISVFPCLILEKDSHGEHVKSTESRYYNGVVQNRADVFVRGEIHSLSDLKFEKIQHGKEIFRWVPMTDDIVNFLYHKDQDCRKISLRYKNESSQFETNGSLPILPTNSMSLYDNRISKYTKATIKPEKEQERDTNQHEDVVKYVTIEGTKLDPPTPSRSAVRNEIKQQWSKRFNTGELRYRYYNKKRLDLISQFENLSLLLILKDKVKSESTGQVFTRNLEIQNRLQRGSELLAKELGFNQKTQDEYPIDDKYLKFKKDLNQPKSKEEQRQKEIYNQLMSRYAYAFLTMNEVGCDRCGVNKGVPCQPEHLGEMTTGKRKAEKSLTIKPETGGTHAFEKKTIAHGYNTIKGTDLENRLDGLFNELSKNETLTWYSKFTISKPSNLKKPRYQRPFVCDSRHEDFTVNTHLVDEILISLGVPLVKRKRIADLSSSKGSDYLFPSETEPSILQQNSLFLLLRRVQLRLFATITGLEETKPGSDRVQTFKNQRLVLEFLKKDSTKLSTVPIDDLITRENRRLDIPCLKFKSHQQNPDPRFSEDDARTNTALAVSHQLVQTENSVQWSSLDQNEMYPVMSVECSVDEILSAAFQHGEGVAISVDSWQINGVNEYIQSKEDKLWKFRGDIFADAEQGARSFSSFLATLEHHKLLDVKQHDVTQQRRILGIISLDELIRVRNTLRKEDRFE